MPANDRGGYGDIEQADHLSIDRSSLVLRCWIRLEPMDDHGHVESRIPAPVNSSRPQP